MMRSAISRLASAAGSGDILLQQQTQPQVVISILQHLQQITYVAACKSNSDDAIQAASGHMHAANSSPDATCSSSASSTRFSSSCTSQISQPQAPPQLPVSRRNPALTAAAGTAAASHAHLQHQQWRGLVDIALNMDKTRDHKQRQQQLTVSPTYAGIQRTEFERQLQAATSLDKLSELLDQNPKAQPRELVTSLHVLNKLNKSHRTSVKQRVKALQQQWGSLRPLDSEQQQQLVEVQQQHKQHQEDLLPVLGKIVGLLTQDQSSLPADQFVQVLSCFGSLGCVQQVDNGSALLLVVLQRIRDGLQALQPKHLALIATSLAQLQDAERGESSHDDMPDASLESSSSSSSSARQPQRQQQQAVSELSRALVLDLCDAVQQPGYSMMDAASLANFVAAMGRLGHYDWQTMRHLGGLVVQQSSAFTCPQVARMLTGFTKLRHYDAEICARLAHVAECDMANGSGVHLAQVMWSLAHQRFEQPSVFEAASIQVPDKVHEMQPRHVANLSWAFAVRKAYSPTLYDALAGRMVQLIEQDRHPDSSSSSSSDSSSTASSSSSSDGSGDGSSDASSSSSSGGSSDSLFLSDNDLVLPHHLSLVAWSFAKQGHKHEPMMLAIADRASQVAKQMLPQNISNAAWAFGSLGVSHPAMFDALAAAAKASKLEGYNSQNITDLAWGFAQAGHQDPELFELIATATTNSLSELSPHSLSDLISAFATTRDPQANKVLEAAIPAATAALPRFSVQMLSDMMCSYAELGIKDEGLLKAAAQVLPLRLVQLEQDTDAQAKIIWTMKQLDWRDADLERVLGGLIPNLSELL